ncbi:MAG: ATP-grasp domain-containing protein [Lachnospiraceae bacterium]|nr:ATP-grasp domain-containing protein [Lachnospiraceae bacterium]
MKVLILGAASVQMDAVLELKKMGIKTYVVAMAKDGPAADVSDHFEPINILDEEAVTKLIINEHIDAVYSTGSDLAMPVACRISERLGLPHFVSSGTAYVCNHKNAMRTALSDACEGNVPFQVMEEASPVTIGFPAILKPSDSQGQRGIFLIHSQEELEAHFEEAKQFSREGKVMVEKYIDGPEVSVNGYMVNGVLRFFAASDRDTWPEYTGLIHRHVVPGRSFSPEAEEKMVRVLQDACNRTGVLNGPVYFQMKVMDDKPYIIEMTPRLDGCHMWNILERASGVNLMRLLFRHLLFDDTSELQARKARIQPMELVFWCQKPKTVMDRGKLELPEDAVFHFYYYEDGEVIRPVNGRFDKIGYYIRNL